MTRDASWSGWTSLVAIETATARADSAESNLKHLNWIIPGIIVLALSVGAGMFVTGYAFGINE